MFRALLRPLQTVCGPAVPMLSGKTAMANGIVAVGLRRSKAGSVMVPRYNLTIFLLRGLPCASLILSEATRREEWARGETGS